MFQYVLTDKTHWGDNRMIEKCQIVKRKWFFI